MWLLMDSFLTAHLLCKNVELNHKYLYSIMCCSFFFKIPPSVMYNVSLYSAENVFLLCVFFLSVSIQVNILKYLMFLLFSVVWGHIHQTWPVPGWSLQIHRVYPR